MGVTTDTVLSFRVSRCSYVDACKRDIGHIGGGKLAHPYQDMWREYCTRRGIWDSDGAVPTSRFARAALPEDLDAMYSSCFGYVGGDTRAGATQWP